MYKSVSHIKLVQICTKLSLTVSWYRYVQQKIFISQEAAANTYKSLPYSSNLSPTGSWYKCVQISPSQ